MTERIELHGIGIGRAVVVGPVVRMAPALPEPPAEPGGEDPGTELATAREAIATVAAELRGRAAVAAAEAEQEAAEVLEAQAMMAEDPALFDEIARIAGTGRTAARAVHEAFGGYREALAAAGPYLAARVADLDDVRQRVVAACLGVPVPGVPDPGHPYVLVAHDLAPADTAVLDLAKVKAFITEAGGQTSHTAVLARARGIPAVVGCVGASDLADGTLVLVDAARGRVVRDPTKLEAATVGPVPGALRSGGTSAPAPGRTKDGVPISLLANVGAPADAAGAVEAGAEGVGLFRTEFAFPDAPVAPDEAVQVDAYHRVFDAFPGRRVVVRVLDAGADKPLQYLTAESGEEPNPALGVRGLRALRREPAVLRTQLKAIAVAARRSDTEVWVMAPMVSEPAEASWFVAQAAEHGLGTAGVMVEVPSAALLADQLLAACAFASIGTNDLAQYALAADRQLGGLAALQDPWHPALLKLVAMVGEAGQRAGKPVGVCGEAAADPLLACVLVGLGVTSLSMAAPALADVREELAARSLEECRELALRALAAESAATAREAASGR
jgi:phosphoenolpyruvate-protein phosphotransferase (PTS system enzyme I)